MLLRQHVPRKFSEQLRKVLMECYANQHSIGQRMQCQHKSHRSGSVPTVAIACMVKLPCMCPLMRQSYLVTVAKCPKWLGV